MDTAQLNKVENNPALPSFKVMSSQRKQLFYLQSQSHILKILVLSDEAAQTGLNRKLTLRH